MVFPGVADTLASAFCSVNKLIKEDLPTLERPMNAYSGRSGAGHLEILGLLIKYFAFFKWLNLSLFG